MGRTSGGFTVVLRMHDGRWTAGSSGIVEDVLAKLHPENDESFSVFRDRDKEGIRWIEPVK